MNLSDALLEADASAGETFARLHCRGIQILAERETEMNAIKFTVIVPADRRVDPVGYQCELAIVVTDPKWFSGWEVY